LKHVKQHFESWPPEWAELDRLALDDAFWQKQSQGLAVFAQQGMIETLSLPEPVPSLAAVARDFYVKPLLPYVAVDCRFHVLWLEEDGVRLFDADKWYIE